MERPHHWKYVDLVDGDDDGGYSRISLVIKTSSLYEMMTARNRQANVKMTKSWKSLKVVESTLGWSVRRKDRALLFCSSITFETFHDTDSGLGMKTLWGWWMKAIDGLPKIAILYFILSICLLITSYQRYTDSTWYFMFPFWLRLVVGDLLVDLLLCVIVLSALSKSVVMEVWMNTVPLCGLWALLRRWLCSFRHFLFLLVQVLPFELQLLQK